MNLNFDDAVTGGNRTYLEPGLHTVRTKEIISGQTDKGSPYIEWVIEDKAGLSCSQRYYLNTVTNAGKQFSAWDITKNVVLSMVKGILGLDDAGAKAVMPRFTTPEELNAKLAPELSKLVVGKYFDIRLNGQEIEGRDGKKNWTKANFGTGFFVAPAGSNKLTFDATKHVKMLPKSDGVSPTMEGISKSNVEPNW